MHTRFKKNLANKKAAKLGAKPKVSRTQIADK